MFLTEDIQTSVDKDMVKLTLLYTSGGDIIRSFEIVNFFLKIRDKLPYGPAI